MSTSRWCHFAFGVHVDLTRRPRKGKGFVERAWCGICRALCPSKGERRRFAEENGSETNPMGQVFIEINFNSKLFLFKRADPMGNSNATQQHPKPLKDFFNCPGGTSHCPAGTSNVSWGLQLSRSVFKRPGGALNALEDLQMPRRDFKCLGRSLNAPEGLQLPLKDFHCLQGRTFACPARVLKQ